MDTSERLIKASVLLQRPCQVCVREREWVGGREYGYTKDCEYLFFTCRHIIFITHCGVCALTFVVCLCV